MNRLSKYFCVLTAAIASLSHCPAQNAQFTIAGDVRVPGNYVVPASVPVELSTLLEQGGVTSESGNAAIIRGTPWQVLSTSSVHAGAQLSLTALAPNDIVIFRRLDQRGAAFPHVVVVGAGIPQIVRLAGDAVPLEQVLATLGLRFAKPVSVVRTGWASEQVLLLGPQQAVQHGDVISLATAGPSSGLRITETYAIQGDSNGSQGVPVAQVSVSDVSLPERAAETSPLRIPPTTPPSAHNPTPQAATLYVPFADPDAVPAEPQEEEYITADAQEFVRDGQMELRSADSVETMESPDTLSVPFHTASLENPLINLPMERESIALEDSYSRAGNDSTGTAVWNTIFVLGIFLALTLIVVGGLKTRREQELEQEIARQSPIAVTPNMEQKQSNEIADGRPETDVDAIVEADVVAEEPERMTADDECPILSVGIESGIPMSSSGVSAAENDLVVPDTREFVASRETVEDSDMLQVESTEWFANDWDVNEQSAHTPGPSDADSAVEPVAADTSLEDLIQNRLPVELKQTQLPLQISLFGKPAGPQRIRIDAAHTQIAAPHMATVARQTPRRQPVAAKQSRETTPPTRRASTSSGENTERNDDASRFDRALNFLQEQSEK